MSRRQAREIALQTLFQLDLNPPGTYENEVEMLTSALDLAADQAGKTDDKSRNFASSLVTGTRKHIQEIDVYIANCARDWKVTRMASVDRNILRMASYELFFADEKLDSNIIINEAVELAKKFGTDDSSRYINGILGTMVKSNIL